MRPSCWYRVVAASVAIVLASSIAPAALADVSLARAPRPGLVGGPLTLQDNTQLSGYDVAVDGTGTTYVGWIGNDSSSTAATRKVRFCTLPPGSLSCAGGIQVIDSLGVSSAAGLRVLATSAGAVTLVWFHDTDPGSVLGPRGGRIAVATSQAGGPLSSATDVADAPSFGQLLDAAFGPDGRLWTIAYKGVGTTSIEVRPGVANPPETLSVPYNVATSRLAFSGSQTVIGIQEYGAISTPIGTAHGSSGAWSGFSAVSNTWSGGSFGMAGATSGVKLVASVANASYYPAIARFTGAGFTTAKLVGDRSACPRLAHDLVADASGRLADVSNLCGEITVSNLPDARHAALTHFAAGNTVAGGDPQIATTPRGRAVVAWSIQSANGNKLLVGRVLLPALRRAVVKHVRQGRIKVRGPASCLPPVGVAVSAKGHGKRGWQVRSTKLFLDGARFRKSVLNGAKLSAGSSHKLVGRVKFARGADRVSRKVTLRFRSCSNP